MRKLWEVNILDPVHTSLTGEQAQKILCINYTVYFAALQAGILERNGVTQCASENSPRLHNIVDLAITGSIINFGWPDTELPWASSFCFDIFDILLEDFDHFNRDWYIQLVNKSGSAFESILKKTPILLEVTESYVGKFGTLKKYANRPKAHYEIFQTCVALLGVCGLRTHYLFLHLAQKEGLQTPSFGIENYLQRVLNDPSKI